MVCFCFLFFHTFLPLHGREYYCHHLYFNSDGVPLTRQSEETRVWQKQSGQWVVAISINPTRRTAQAAKKIDSGPVHSNVFSIKTHTFGCV